MAVAEEQLGEARLQGDQRRLVHVAEGEVAAADEVVHFVAEDAVSGVLGEDIADDLDGELERGEGEADPEKGAKAFLAGGGGGVW